MNLMEDNQTLVIHNTVYYAIHYTQWLTGCWLRMAGWWRELYGRVDH